ncbi:uncharacterized protein LOC142235841 [Haematobia irritans]|uniref:uncharacterized protein LOC142235841 n=1 Tax=Haematobia irritans TaxID=7368 RepID=UPI003F5085FE
MLSRPAALKFIFLQLCVVSVIFAVNIYSVDLNIVMVKDFTLLFTIWSFGGDFNNQFLNSVNLSILIVEVPRQVMVHLLPLEILAETVSYNNGYAVMSARAVVGEKSRAQFALESWLRSNVRTNIGIKIYSDNQTAINSLDSVLLYSKTAITVLTILPKMIHPLFVEDFYSHSFIPDALKIDYEIEDHISIYYNVTAFRPFPGQLLLNFFIRKYNPIKGRPSIDILKQRNLDFCKTLDRQRNLSNDADTSRPFLLQDTFVTSCPLVNGFYYIKNGTVPNTILPNFIDAGRYIVHFELIQVINELIKLMNLRFILVIKEDDYNENASKDGRRDDEDDDASEGGDEQHDDEENKEDHATNEMEGDGDDDDDDDGDGDEEDPEQEDDQNEEDSEDKDQDQPEDEVKEEEYNEY